MPSSGDTFGSRELEGELNYYLLFQQTDSSNGTWVTSRGLISGTVHAVGLESGATLTIQVSNLPDPNDSDNHVTDLTISGDGAEKFIKLTKLPAYGIKAKKVAGTTPTATTVYFVGVKRG